MCERLASHLVPRFGSLPAESREEAFESLWEEHVAERDAVSDVLRRWADSPTVTNETEEVFSQCFLRITGAVAFINECLDDGRDCSAFPESATAARLFEFVTVDLWQTDDWPREWIQRVADRQHLE